MAWLMRVSDGATAAHNGSEWSRARPRGSEDEIMTPHDTGEHVAHASYTMYATAQLLHACRIFIWL
jgi:hypothetical protein